MGNLIAPWLAGIVYEKAGYYAVFAIILAIIAFDFILRVVMIEKRTAAKWLSKPEAASPGIRRGDNEEWRTDDERDSVCSRPEDYQVINPNETPPLRDQISDIDETSPLLHKKANRSSNWFVRTFPRMTLLLSSPRIIAATWGAFAHTMLIGYLDATLPLFVKRTFHWGSRGAGLIFLASSAPSLLGTLFGMLSDCYGTRKVSFLGFALLVPSIALLGTVTNDSIGEIVLLCILLVLAGQSGFAIIVKTITTDIIIQVLGLMLYYLLSQQICSTRLAF